jgi:hypothetical protein
MKIPEEIIERIANDLMKELEEVKLKAGKHITFDDIELKMLEARQRIGEILMQKAITKQTETKAGQKKTAQNAKAKSRTKGSRINK